jgi:hypothetical protein
VATKILVAFWLVTAGTIALGYVFANGYALVIGIIGLTAVNVALTAF